jgi:GrpB-like predicted nucleotidyltransferase (UPF0157 family)
VPGLPAKPVLDIAAAVVRFDCMPEIVRRLERSGYLYRGDHGDAGGYLFVVESSPDIRTIHLHVVEHCGSQWRNYLLFRDLLRHRPAIRRRYAELKAELAGICRDDRGSYTALKADFIRGILENNLAPVDDSGNESRSDASVV